MKYVLGVSATLVLSACALQDSAVEESASVGAEIVAMPEHVDRPNAASATAATSLKYYGGKVIPNAKVYVVWWGNGSNLLPEITRPTGGIADFYAGIMNSPYVDSLSEYSTNINVQVGTKAGTPGTNQMIGRGNYAGTYSLTSIPASNNITDDQIQATIEAAINAGTLPMPDDNTLYAMYFPRAVKITIEGMRSCSYFGAYHFATPANQHHAAYAVMPDCGYNFAGVTRVSSHELSEAITDAVPTPGSHPDYPQAWNTVDGSEVADICDSSNGSVPTATGTWQVQGNWDELSHSCKVTHPLAGPDYSLSTATPTGSLSAGSANTFTFQTATTVGAAQQLRLSVTAPAGVTATLSSTTVTAGESVTVTLTADPGIAVKDGQVVVKAVGAGNSTHTASLLVQVAQ